MRKVVVFGGSGFLGSYVVDELIKRGFNVTIADLFKSDHFQDNQAFQEVDILNIKDVISVLKDASFVYNFSAIAELDEAKDKPINTFQVNVMGNLNILEACRQIGGIDRVVYASSAYALSNAGSFYGLSKQSSEKLTEEYFKKYGLKYTVIRYGSLYGERAGENNYIYKLLRSAIETGELHFKGDGEDLREYIHAGDELNFQLILLRIKNTKMIT